MLFVAILAGQSFSLAPLQEPVSHLWPRKQHFNRSIIKINDMSSSDYSCLERSVQKHKKLGVSANRSHRFLACVHTQLLAELFASVLCARHALLRASVTWAGAVFFYK
jgi:hypothetical protein